MNRRNFALCGVAFFYAVAEAQEDELQKINRRLTELDDRLLSLSHELNRFQKINVNNFSEFEIASNALGSVENVRAIVAETLTAIDYLGYVTDKRSEALRYFKRTQFQKAKQGLLGFEIKGLNNSLMLARSPYLLELGGRCRSEFEKVLALYVDFGGVR